MAYRDKNAAQVQHITTLRVLLGVTWLLIAGQGVVLYEATRELPSIDIPPDLTAGVTVTLGDHHAANVYAFALTIWQGVNRWQQDGRTEYAETLFAHQCYLTPEFYRQLELDLAERARKGRLDHRARGLHVIPSMTYKPWRVRREADGVWTVWLDLQLIEHQVSTQVKSPIIRYPLTVQRWDAERTCNPYGVALAGYTEDGPRRLTPEEITAVEGGTHDESS